MIRFEGRVVDVLFKIYQSEPSRKDLTLYEWLTSQSKQLGIKRIYGFDYALVFESPEDEIVFRLRFGL